MFQSKLLQKTAHRFRTAYKQQEKKIRAKNSRSKRGGNIHELTGRFNAAIVYVSSGYKLYEKVVLKGLKEIYDYKTNTLKVEDWRKYIWKYINVCQDMKGKKLSKQCQKQLHFAAYIIKEIMPERKSATF
eukprot:128785_1